MTARDQQKLGRCRAGTLTALRGNPPHRHLDLRLLDPRPGRQYISAVRAVLVRGTLLQRPWQLMCMETGKDMF